KDILPWEGYAEGDRPIRSVGIWEEPSVWFNSCLTYAGLPAYSKLQLAEMGGGKPLPRDGDQHLMVCPDANPAASGPKDDLVVDGYFMMWGLTADGLHPERRKTYWSYGYNTQLDEGVEDRHSSRRVSLGNFKRICEIPILVEKIMRPDEYDPPYGPFMSSVCQSEVSWHEFTTRHNKGGHLLFLDNHVAYFTLQQILNAPRAPDDYNQPGKVIWNPAPGGVSR
ncbi:MAG TPA: hypothetical protein VMC06_03790, partial [Opitutaceae bacterium]|nr:hypothetical protein [Opitutaceae bacterium]